MSHASVIESEYDEWVVERNYVQEAERTLYNNSSISIENALVLNKQMQIYLNDLKNELDQLLETCQLKYKQNEEILVKMTKTKSEPKLYTTYYFCGYPFFKDRKGGGPPQSAEYLRRKGDELFPLDLDKRGVWLPRDKVELIHGVKKQVIEHLRKKNRDKIRQTAGKRCASELTARIQNESSALESMHLKDLLKQSEGMDFRINWVNISMDDLQDRRTPNECIGMWYGYLMPTLNRKAWTEADEDRLLNAANDFDNEDWMEIAKAVENRSAFQCFVHFQTKFNAKTIPKNVRWTTEQDKMLMDCIEKYRIGNVIPWTKVLEHFPMRTKHQIYNRYMFSLNPEISRAPFTVEEDCILMAAIKEYNYSFRDFPSNLLPGRNMRQIRSRYNNVLKHVNVREHWTEEHDIQLMKLVEQFGTSEWVKISDKMVSHSRTSCRQRYTTIKKFLDKHRDKTVSDVPRRKRPFSTNVTTDNWMDAIIEAKHFESIRSMSADEEENDKPTKKSAGKVLVRPVVQLHNTPYFDFMKYSFNFKFGEKLPGTDALFENIQIACQLLQVPSLPQKIDLYNESFSGFVSLYGNCKKVKLEPELLKSLIQLGKNDFQFPVNLNTIVGLRGLTTMFNWKPDRKIIEKKKEPTKSIKQEPNTFGNHNELNLFKSRFKSIFKQTAALAKMHRTPTIVSLRLRNQKRKNEPKATPTTTTTTTDFYNNETVVRVANDSTAENVEFTEYIVTESEERPNKRRRVTVLESITVDLNTSKGVDRLHHLQPSTSNQTYRYRVKPSDTVQEIEIQPYISESETEGMMSDDPGTFSNTEFVIWTPTITDEATGTTKSTTKTYKQNQ